MSITGLSILIVIIVLSTHTEQFRVVKKYPKYYVSNLGRVLNTKTTRFLKAHTINSGYRLVNLYNNKTNSQLVHRIVAEQWHPNPENKRCVDHIDGNKLNNSVSNLRWVTYSQNGMNRKKESGTTSKYKGVYLKNGRWVSQININGSCQKYIGSFVDEADAARAYNEFAITYYGEFGKLNIID